MLLFFKIELSFSFYQSRYIFFASDKKFAGEEQEARCKSDFPHYTWTGILQSYSFESQSLRSTDFTSSVKNSLGPLFIRQLLVAAIVWMTRFGSRSIEIRYTPCRAGSNKT